MNDELPMSSTTVSRGAVAADTKNSESTQASRISSKAKELYPTIAEGPQHGPHFSETSPGKASKSFQYREYREELQNLKSRVKEMKARISGPATTKADELEMPPSISTSQEHHMHSSMSVASNFPKSKSGVGTHSLVDAATQTDPIFELYIQESDDLRSESERQSCQNLFCLGISSDTTQRLCSTCLTFSTTTKQLEEDFSVAFAPTTKMRLFTKLFLWLLVLIVLVVWGGLLSLFIYMGQMTNSGYNDTVILPSIHESTEPINEITHTELQNNTQLIVMVGLIIIGMLILTGAICCIAYSSYVHSKPQGVHVGASAMHVSNVDVGTSITPE
ncbi:hypothetical protein SK128_015481 [Halocaridina rubra]|uniref:Uncharacterized protein n=1 Tax=Halocaridina rubra TaxID=373956 RepID=A0AAN8XDC1_HALRR